MEIQINCTKEEFEKIIQKISEDIVRHYANDYILNMLNGMKLKNESEEKMYKWFVKTCSIYGHGGEEYSFNCTTKGVVISKPFEMLLRWKEVYKRVKDLPFVTPKERLKDKKITIVLKHKCYDDYKLNIRDRVPIETIDGHYDYIAGDYEGYIGGAGLESFEGNTLDEKKKELTEWLLQMLLDDGYSKENISVKEIPLDEKDMNEWKERHQRELEREIAYAEKDIKEYSEKLNKALKTKYGKEVEIEFNNKEDIKIG